LAVFTYVPMAAIAGATEDWQTAYDAELAGELDLAIHHYTRAIQSGELTQTGLSRVFRSRGNVHLASNNLDSALKDFDTSVSLDPTYHLAYVSRGVVYHERQNFGQALDDYDQAIKLNPNYALSYANRGGAYEQLEQIDEAVLDFQKAYELGYREDWLIEVLTAYDALP
jgi:tetratricopeptide (TPR) repeat protein